MKFNKWTLGLAAVGAVSLTSAVTARAMEDNMSQWGAMVNGMIISGGVDVSMEWMLAPCGDDSDNSMLNYVPFRMGKQDGFNLNVVELNVQKPQDESEWAAGYMISLLFGPDAIGYQTLWSQGDSGWGYGSGMAIKQAYVALRTPVGNGIDWKIGVFDTIIGYEVFESWNNPNFTRSWGYAIEPTEHTGILGTYQINEMFSVKAGVANTLYAGINSRNDQNGNPSESWWCKTYMAAVAFTAPDSWGSMAGSTLYGGIVQGWNGSDDQMNLYAGAVINTPVEGFTAGIAYDFVRSDSLNILGVGTANGCVDVVGVYASFKATEKLSLHGRAEYGWWDVDTEEGCFYGLTGTVQYDLWENVISRIELRYEVNEDFGDELSIEKCGVGLYASIAYKF